MDSFDNKYLLFVGFNKRLLITMLMCLKLTNYVNITQRKHIQSMFTYSKSTVKTLEQGVKYVQR